MEESRYALLMIITGLVTCDPSNRLRDAVEHIDKDLSALVCGLWCFIWGWLICVCFVRTWREGHLSVQLSHRSGALFLHVAFPFCFVFSHPVSVCVEGEVGGGWVRMLWLTPEREGRQDRVVVSVSLLFQLFMVVLTWWRRGEEERKWGPVAAYRMISNVSTGLRLHDFAQLFKQDPYSFALSLFVKSHDPHVKENRT